MNDLRQQTDEALWHSHAGPRSHDEELTRFTHVAVGRELRIIELKQQVNELCQQHGEGARYPLEFEHDTKPAKAESPTVPPGDSLVPLAAVLCTEELNRRPTRAPDYETENRALAVLVLGLADSPRTILQTLADTLLEVFRADSAGLSLLTKDEKSFFWPAIAGAWRPHAGGGTPRDFGPSGDVLDCNAPMLFKHFERRYPYLLAVTPPAEECLLVPFHVKGKAVGTIWAIAHDDRRKFDAEDLRQLESLGRFASAAYQAMESLGALEQRRAALSLMEDEVQSRHTMEKLNMELRQNEQRYRAFVTASSDAMYRMSPDWSEMRELQGRNYIVDTEKPSRTWLQEYIHPDDQPHVMEVINEAIRTRSIFELEHRVRRVDGTLGWTFSRAIPLLDAEGEIVEWFGAASDVSERKRAEEALREAGERFRFMAESMPQKMFTARPNGDVDYCNPRWNEFTGVSFEQIRDWGWTQFIHPDDMAENIRIWQHSIDTGEPFEFEHRLRRADGQHRWHIGRALPMQDSAGRVVMWVGTSTDVQGIKQTESDLRESEVRYRRRFEAAYDGILILDAASGKITHANPFMSQLLGYTQGELMGRELWQIGSFSDKSASEATVRELQKKGYIRYEHLPLETKRGQGVEVEVVANVYREDHQSVIQCNIRDITERSRLERKALEQVEALADLHRRKDEFLAMLSHELRSPLAPLSNAVHLLRLQKNEDPVQQQARSIIERQVGQLKHLVDDLLEVSRITTGRVQLHQERVAIGGIVERAVETARPLIVQRRHELTVSLPPQPIWLYADAGRLEQVVVNLLNNAAKYTDESGHIRLTVQQEGDAAVLRVRDTGVGIAPELLPRIFNLFTQAKQSLDRSQGGLGIGLCLVQRLVELHGGAVEAYSVLGQGSEFVVRLPAMRNSMPSSPAPSTETAQRPGKRYRVLVVDDNVDTAQTMAMLLQASGHDVQMAYDGPSALEAALDYRPDVALLDIGLPGLDGYELAKRIRQQPVPGNVVLVAMTGYGKETDRQRSQDAGFDHHLVKPVDFGKVQKILATVSERPRGELRHPG